MKARRPVAFLVACWFVFLSVWTPRQAFAFAPVAVLAAPQIASAGGASYAIGALSGLIGIVGLYFTIEDAQENAVRIPLGPNANNEPPAPSAAATTTPVTSTQFGCSGDGYQGSVLTGWFYADTFAEACAAACAVVGGTYTPGGSWCSGTGGSVHLSTGTQSSTDCPSGYTMNGSTCTLVSARQATDDKTCDILLSSGQFATADDMNCPATADGSKLSPILRDGKAIAYGTNSNGEPIMWEVRPPRQDWPYYTLRQYEQTQTATQTQVKTTEVTIDPATSEITSVATSTSPGSLASPSASSVPTQTDPQTQPTTSENTPTVTTRTGEDVLPEFPDDYAREPTVKEIRDALTQQKPAPDDPTSRTESEIGDQFFKTTFDTLKGWTLPGHSSQCPTGSFAAFGSTHVIDAHCALINSHWGTLQAAMLVVWSIAALWIVLRA